MLFSGTTRWWLVAYLLLTLTCTATWLLLGQRLAEQSGLRRQVWLSSDFQGVPFISDVSPGAGLEFLDDDPRLPRRFFSARWLGYWYVPTDQSVTFRVDADDYVNIWIDGELVFPRSIAAIRVIALNAGIHELRIEYQQYAGPSHLALLVGSSGAYPRPLQTANLFPDQPEADILRLLAVRKWLLVTVCILWIVGALATIPFVLRRRRTSATTNNVLQTSVPNRYDVAALATLSLAMLIYGYGNLSMRQSATDSLENLTLGIRLAQEGVYQRWPGQVGDHRREPFGPSLIAITDLAADTLGHERVPLECISNESVFRREYCRLAYVPYRIINLGLILTAALGVFLLVLRLTGSRVLAYLGFLMTAQSAALLASADTFLTEIHAAALMVAGRSAILGDCNHTTSGLPSTAGAGIGGTRTDQGILRLPVDSYRRDACRSRPTTARHRLEDSRTGKCHASGPLHSGRGLDGSQLSDVGGLLDHRGSIRLSLRLSRLL